MGWIVPESVPEVTRDLTPNPYAPSNGNSTLCAARGEFLQRCAHSRSMAPKLPHSNGSLLAAGVTGDRRVPGVGCAPDCR